MSGIDYGEFVVVSTKPRTLKILTKGQCETIGRFGTNYHNDATRMIVHVAGFELPEGYVTCAIYDDDKLIMFYGIAPDGQASS